MKKKKKKNPTGLVLFVMNEKKNKKKKNLTGPVVFVNNERKKKKNLQNRSSL